MLKLDWYVHSPIDFEHKNYVLLSYLKQIDESYSIHRLSPYLLHTEKIVEDMKRFELAEWEFKKFLWTPVISFSLASGVERKEIKKNGELKEIIEIVSYSIPLLESKINLGYKLLKKYPQILF